MAKMVPWWQCAGFSFYFCIPVVNFSLVISVLVLCIFVLLKTVVDLHWCWVWRICGPHLDGCDVQPWRFSIGCTRGCVMPDWSIAAGGPGLLLQALWIYLCLPSLLWMESQSGNSGCCVGNWGYGILMRSCVSFLLHFFISEDLCSISVSLKLFYIYLLF